MKIKTFDKATLKQTQFQEKAAEALRALAAEFGLTVAPNGGTIEDTKLTLKFVFRVDDPEAAEAQQRKQFNDFCILFDMKPEHFGAVFLYKGTPWTICGIEPGRPKYCVRARRPDGKVMLFSRSVVATAKIPAQAA